MSKKLNKLVAIAIGISVMSGSIIPALAADNVTKQADSTSVKASQMVNGKPLLSLDEAIKEAISSSNTLLLDDYKINYQNTSNDVNEDLDDANGVSDDKKDYNKDTRENSLNQLKQQRDFDVDTLTQKVTKAYNAIVTSQMKIDNAAKELEINNKLLNDQKLKFSLGIVTETNLKTTELQIQKAENDQKLSMNTLKDAQYNFKVLTGKDVTQYSLEQDITYEKLKIDGDLDEYFDSVIESYLKYKSELIALEKDYYHDSDNKVTQDDVTTAKNTSDSATAPTITDGETYEQYMEAYNKYESEKSAYKNALSSRLTYLSTKLSMDQSDTSLDETKKQLKETLKGLYTSILSEEDTINYEKQNIELTNKQLSDAKLKYDLGLITQSDYDKLVASDEELNIELRSAIDSYNTLKTEIEKPWIVSSSAS